MVVVVKVLQSARGEWVPTAEISGPALPRQKERRALPPLRGYGTLYTRVCSKAAPSFAWQLMAKLMMIIAEGNGTAARTTQVRAARARARPPLAFELRSGSIAIPSHPQLLTANSQHPRQEIRVPVTW
ncbi:hypothetical protein SVAN01_05461 [Stagonosporopsis vannaccii]|nr:hypothetical protein SVAN01_05461 [Stagonosporopsis vannaccii]